MTEPTQSQRLQILRDAVAKRSPDFTSLPEMSRCMNIPISTIYHWLSRKAKQIRSLDLFYAYLQRIENTPSDVAKNPPRKGGPKA